MAEPFCQDIIIGNDVILDVKTCGKTWAVNMIVAHETLQRDDATALFVIPNQSILFENIQDICETD